MTIPFQRPRRAGVRPSPIFLGVLAVAIGSGVLVWGAGNTASRGTRFMVFVFVVAAWVVTLCLHEFSHAFLAWRFGDHDVHARGYLTLNPLKYNQWVLSILLPLLFIAIGGIGLPGGAVFLHPGVFRTKAQRAAVSLAGPAVNAVATVILLIAVSGGPSSGHLVFFFALSFFALLQLMAAILNLLPIPGLDGYGALEPYLSPDTQRGFEPFKPFGMLAFFVLLQVPQINKAFFDVVYSVFDTFGADRSAASLGYSLMRFWTN